MRYKLKELFIDYSFVLPAVLMFGLFSVYPYFRVFWLSLCESDGLVTESFIGFRHFADIFLRDPVWWEALLHAGYITLLALIFQNGLALLLALAVAKNIRGGNLYRVIFFIPPILSGIVVGLIWDWIYNGDYGFLNHILRIIGLAKYEKAWLSSPKTALTCVAVMHMWKGFGWGFIILLAGLQSIPEELYEAAHVDGASSWHRFKHITVPLMIPVFFLVSILTILGTMRIFDIIVATTRGGPGYHTEVPITRILHSMRGTMRYGYACAQGLVFGVVLIIASLIQLRYSRKTQQ